ncbi:sperm flagellar protein 2-like isoform X2 [Mercenaria mercenaria]|uniref:sperm flagellar protein 2-like isoform X2 n=1 Tax=Mercenaria mercenaria TaxID=6596 RepID=UPI00234EFA9E|nr:sperm flagellar protein 2-like isoform X2 [Mercenaria mercenaria]
MTDILCRWLNDELKISQTADPTTFERDFASGYLIGEVLQKYQLQDDFDKFSQSKTADSKLNNFTRIEPTLHLLSIPFDTNLARAIMTETHGVATRLMYQLYIALNNKKKSNLTGVAIETMRPAAPAKLNAVESGIYKDRLKHVTPRQSDLELQDVFTRFHEKQIAMEKVAFKERFLEQERIREQQQKDRKLLLERSRAMKLKQSEMVARIQAATVQIPQPPPQKTVKAMQARAAGRRMKIAEGTVREIADFEEKMKMVLPPTKDEDDEGIGMEYIMGRDEEKSQLESIDLIKPASNDEYIGKIRKRLHEDASARAEREKRRRKVLVDQIKAHESQEEAHREEMLVNRLMRQSQQERRIAVQLLQTRHEKEVIRKNRIMREQMYEERRLKDFEEALNREQEMARLAKQEYEEQTKKDKALHDKIAAERAEAKYRKHYEMCQGVVDQIVDFTCKVTEYRELTNKLVPAKLMREWRAQFEAGIPLYEKVEVEEPAEPTAQQVLEEERQNLLDEGDFLEYKNMVGEWQPPEGCEISGPPRDNPVVGHVVQRLLNMVYPPSTPPPPPEFPPFPIRACVLGKAFAGKSSCIRSIANEHRLQLLNVDELVNEAIEAHKAGEVMEVTEEEEEKPVEKPVEKPSSGLLYSKIQIKVRAPTGEGIDTPIPIQQFEELQKEATPGEATPSESQTNVTEGQESQETKPAEDQPTESQSGENQPAEAPKEEQQTTARKTPSKPKQPKQQPTPRAKLGSKAFKSLKKGQPVDDQVQADILVEAIRRVPEGTGWVIDGFPLNYNQAKMLEKALSGFDAAAKEGKGKPLKSKKSVLAPDPRPSPVPADPASGLDVVIVFDINDDLCLKRAAGRTKALLADKDYQQEFNPPPEGSATGVGKQEKVIEVEDPAHDQEQIQHRITGFLDNWPKLEKWFSKFGTLQKVDATQGARSVKLEVEKILEDTLNRLQGKDQESSAQPVEQTETVEEKKEEPPAPPPEPPKTPPEEEKKSSRPSSRKGSGKKGSRSSSKESRSKSPKDKDKKRDKSGSPKRGASSKGDSAKKSRGSSPKSKKGSGKKAKTPEPEPEPEPEVPAGPPPPQPGSEEWEFVDQFINENLAKVLADHWEHVENMYIKNGKFVFRKIRDERENIYRYFYQIRKDFLAYLRRPDHKQEFVSQFQKEYNEIPDDMRDDDETKMELHQRVDDLRERLWNICDERKEQAENERETVMNDGWLDDRLGVLSNFYITLMQAEVDRFQDTVRMMKDYYRGMEGEIPDELNPNYIRLPLVELPVERPGSPEKSPSEGQQTPPSNSRPGTGKSDRSKSPRSPKGSRSKSPREKSPKGSKSRSRTPSAKKRDKSKEKDKPAEVQNLPTEAGKRIPLVPRRPTSADENQKAAAAAKSKDKKKREEGYESPVPPEDPDEKLIFNAFHTGLTNLSNIMSAEEAAREAADEAERLKEAEKQKELALAAAAAKTKPKGKGKKSRSPSPKKGGKKDETASTPQPPSEPESEEDKQKKDVRDRMKQEYFFAIQEEEQACRKRMELIKITASAVLQDLKNKADNAFKDKNDWLGARYLKEMESIDHMSEIVRNAIENKTKIKQQLVLQQQDFLLNEDLAVLKTPTPLPPEKEIEIPTSDCFTVAQLMNLYSQFATTAPTGVMSNRAFMETFENMVAVTHGMEQLPEVWLNITQQQIQDIANGSSSDNEYVDWRRFLIALVMPIPVPTQSELLDTLARFKDMDQKSTGFVTREQYDRMNLWFSTEDESCARLAMLKAALFDIFAEHNRTPPVVDYVGMLLYFSATRNAQEGLMRALSVASGTHMPRILKPITKADSVVNSPDIPDDPDDITPPPPPEDIPAEAIDAVVPLDALYRVLHHGETAKGDSHRFSVTADPEDSTSREKLASVYQELGDESLSPVPFKVLAEHPLVQDIIQACKTFKALDLKSILSSNDPLIEATSTKTGE